MSFLVWHLVSPEEPVRTVSGIALIVVCPYDFEIRPFESQGVLQMIVQGWKI
jgi:hypothetical protein